MNTDDDYKPLPLGEFLLTGAFCWAVLLAVAALVDWVWR